MEIYRRLRQKEIEPSQITSVSVVGYGQIGKMLSQELGAVPNLSLSVATRRQQHENEKFSKDFPQTASRAAFGAIEPIMATNPEVVILAVPNPTTQALEELKKANKSDFILVLPSNGIGVVEEAQRIFSDRSGVKIVRASIFTAVSEDADGRPLYNRRKKRIAFAPVRADNETVKKVEKLFKSIGFKTALVENYRALEWTKLLTNTLGATSMVTGCSAKDTFGDPDLFMLELKAFKQRLRLMRSSGIALVNLPWQNMTILSSFFLKLPEKVILKDRFIVAEVMAKQRGNLVSAAWRKIEEGKSPQEGLYYFGPFIELARQIGGSQFPVVDAAIIEILDRHMRGEINLLQMEPETRKRLLLTTCSNAPPPG